MNSTNKMKQILNLIILPILFAAMLLAPFTALAQQSKFDELLKKYNSTENEFRKSKDQQKQIELIAEAIETLDTINFKINSSEFTEGSELEKVSPERRKQFVTSLQTTSIQRRYAYAQLLQQTGQYSDATEALTKAIADSESVEGKGNIRAIEYRLKRNVSSWLSEADAESVDKWKKIRQDVDAAGKAFRNGKLPEASEAFQRATTMLEELKLFNTMAYGEVLANHSELLLRQEKLPEAEAAFRKAIEVNDRLLEMKSSTNANMRRSFSNVFFESGRYAESLEALDEADALFVKLGQEDTRARGFGLFMKGKSLQKLERYPEATKSYYDCAKIMVKNNDNQLFNALQESLYGCYEAMNDVTEPPSAVAEKAVAIGVESFQDNQVDLSNWLLTIAKTKKDKGELADCIAIYERTEQVFDGVDGFQKMLAYRACLSDLGKMYEQKGKIQQAIPFVEKALQSAELVSGRDSNDYVSNATWLAKLYMTAKEHEKAEQLIAKLYNQRIEKVGANDRLAQHFLFLRAQNQFDAQNWEEAIKHWEKLDSLQEKVSVMDANVRLAGLNQLAEAYDKTGKADLAAATRERIKKMDK